MFGSKHTKHTQCHDQSMKDQLRAELLVELRAEVRAEVLGEITQLKDQYATLAAFMKTIGHPLPNSPNEARNGDGREDASGDHTSSLLEHNGQVTHSSTVLGLITTHSFTVLVPIATHS